MRPQRSPRYIEHQLRDAACFRMSRRNIGRQLIFAPYLVVKVGMNPAEQRRLACEAAASQAAAAHPFWQGGALRAWRLWGVGLAARRGRPARLDDYDRVRAFVDRRLELAGRYPRAAIAALLARAPLHARLSRERRAALRAVAGDGALPMTSMHGDLHLFNFATLDDGLRLLDWEHFEPAGSFAYDAVDFEMASLREDCGAAWEDFLDALPAEHEVFARVGARVGVPPAALFAYYLLLKTGILVKRRGADHASSAPFLGALGRQIDRLAS